jgi:aryl-alcohol dehydrogenase-like predicted oxidoreductase
VATFCFAKEGRLGKLATKIGRAPNIGLRLKAMQVNRRYLTNLATRLLASVGRVLLSFGMRFRTYKNSDLTVSEVGFGLWTISTGWWGSFTEGEAVALMRKAFDLGVTLFDAADTYGNGLSEELIAKAFPNQRDEIVIATKVGYDFVHHGEARGRGQREIPQDFSPEAITRATDAALKRLKTDRIDLLQLHNIRMEQVYDDALWKTLEALKSEGKVRYYGIALGPAIGWLYEGVNCIRERDLTSVQHIYNMLEQYPGRAFHDAATEIGKDTMFLIRVTHSSGMLEGKYTSETKFPPTDHRSHRPRSWLLNGIKKVEQLRFLENAERTLGQAALRWLLADDRVASTLPNIYNEEQLVEFAKAPDTAPLTKDDMAKIEELYSGNFGIEEEPPKFKGTMEMPKETAAA